jgi:hypothetical protein
MTGLDSLGVVERRAAIFLLATASPASTAAAVGLDLPTVKALAGSAAFAEVARGPVGEALSQLLVAGLGPEPAAGLLWFAVEPLDDDSIRLITGTDLPSPRPAWWIARPVPGDHPRLPGEAVEEGRSDS